MAKSGPGRDEGHNLYVRPKLSSQVFRVWFREKCHVEPLRGCLQEWCRDDQISQPPKFDNEQIRFQKFKFANGSKRSSCARPINRAFASRASETCVSWTPPGIRAADKSAQRKKKLISTLILPFCSQARS